MIKESDSSPIHSQASWLKQYANYYCSTKELPPISVSETIQVDTNPPSDLEVTKGIGLLKWYGSAESHGLPPPLLLQDRWITVDICVNKTPKVGLGKQKTSRNECESTTALTRSSEGYRGCVWGEFDILEKWNVVAGLDWIQFKPSFCRERMGKLNCLCSQISLRGHLWDGVSSCADTHTHRRFGWRSPTYCICGIGVT